MLYGAKQIISILLRLRLGEAEFSIMVHGLLGVGVGREGVQALESSLYASFPAWGDLIPVVWMDGYL